MIVDEAINRLMGLHLSGFGDKKLVLYSWDAEGEMVLCNVLGFEFDTGESEKIKIDYD